MTDKPSLDSRTTISQLQDEVQQFVEERNWEQYHTPKNLGMSIAIEAAEILEQFVVTRPNINSIEDETAVTADIMCLEAAVLVGHRQATELLLDRLANSDFHISSRPSPTCIPRHLGGAAALLGRYDEARKYYDEALKVATDMKFRPEIALTRLNLAELLLQHYPKEKAAALKHLDFAIKEFRDMKMQPSLERALRHKEILET